LWRATSSLILRDDGQLRADWTRGSRNSALGSRSRSIATSIAIARGFCGVLPCICAEGDDKGKAPRGGVEHEDLAVIFNNLAALFLETGRLAEAEQLYERALAIKEKMLGARHPEVGVTLNNLAILHRRSGRPDAARVLYRRALSIFTARLGAHHPRTATCRANYRRLLRETPPTGGDVARHPAGQI